ncbi:hypothetical protein A6V36_09155 [Paraburkholderia ginsengiterrae]|uniref:Phage tail protein n=1 Tax=Paraburkholderia ginsengiterrae TaxID=1462993 RepID=A0A1A9N6Y6_9BURK|nr:hypothetical protein [Paraburkholderia ginsengiterrae]OAJ54985.1 hypothetical protein A6V36_09155 [Paraburkholderia ginsengiterrae]OAJ61168.1 hypothetical protein A6V37_03490 [Paraburkholderia ginsengiterrae]
MYHAMQMDITCESGIPVARFTIAGQSSLLGVADIEAMIAELARIRAAMQPVRPLNPPAGEYPMEVDPCWRVDRPPQFNGAVLSLRHIGIGWTAFALPPPSMTSLVEALSSCPVDPLPGEQTLLN